MLFSSVSHAERRLHPTWRWQNFSVAELACRCRGRFCGGHYWHDPHFLDLVQALRDRIGRPLTIRSGHRCALWNAQVGGAPQSQHKRIAVDIALAGHDRFQLLGAAREIGFGGLGLARSFLHLDPRRIAATWYYHGSKELWMTSSE